MLEKAKFILKDSRTEIHVMFNPESYSVESNVSFSESSSIKEGFGILQFSKISPKTMSVDLFFDTMSGAPFSIIGNMTPGSEFIHAEDVSTYTTLFHDLIKWDKNKKSTPVVLFTWGNYSFEGVVTKISEKFTMFRPDGVPIRANLSVSMTEYHGEKEKKNPLSSGAKLAAASIASTAMTDVTEQKQQQITQAAKALL